MKIMQLHRDDIPLVTKGGNQALIDEITEALDMCERTNCVLYVRYGPSFLQRLRVDREYLGQPGVQEMLLDEDMWVYQEPNQIQRRRNNG